MDENELWRAVDEQRQVTVDLLRDLSPQEWGQASLCESWTIRDVAAHLTFPLMGPGAMAGMMLHVPRAALGGTNAMIAQGARWVARKRSTDELVDRVGQTIGGRRTMPGLGVEEMLIDAIAHGFDIAEPLGRPARTDLGGLVVAAERVVSYDGRGSAKVFKALPLGGLRLVATDVAWSHGAGAEVRGPMVDLFLLLTGRTPHVSVLEGIGADVLRRRLRRPVAA